MKIILLTNGIYPFVIGGMQKHSYYLAKHIAKQGVIVDVYHPGIVINEAIHIEDYFDTKELEYINFIVVPFPKVVNFPGHYIYASYLYSKALFKKVGILNEQSFIYAQGFTSWYFLKKAPFQSNLISNLHGLEMFQYTINFRNRLEQFLLKIPARTIIKKSNKQVSLGGKLTGILYANGAKSMSVIEIPNGIDSSWIVDRWQENNPKDKMKFIFIGRYERRKGIQEFQQVILETIDTLDYEVLFIGPIPKEKQIRHPNVKYLGVIKDVEVIKRQLLAVDVLVCPSYSEGMPTVILEAMACGCAIIATDVGAVKTMVDDSNGWLIEGDIVSGLRESINIGMKTSYEEFLMKKNNSIDKVKNDFTWEIVIAQTIKEMKF
jgi:glycosyltransferase involved in cell wall biosynthesis